jgi:hypothetical protein
VQLDLQRASVAEMGAAGESPLPVKVEAEDALGERLRRVIGTLVKLVR